jgi:TolB protein
MSDKMRIALPFQLHMYVLLVGLFLTGCDPQIALLELRFQSVAGPTGYNYQRPRWSPDGTKLSFQAYDTPGGSAIWIINSDGSGLKRVTDAALYSAEPDWSPDGRQMIFTSLDGTIAQLFVMDVDGGGRRQVSHFPQFAAYPKWSPDGTRIAFALDTGKTEGGYQVYVMNVDGSNVVQLTRSPLSDVVSFEWSPDSTRIAFVARATPQDAREVKSGAEIGPFLYVMNADGTSQTKLLPNSPGEYYPTWSPDGKQILFSFHDFAEGDRLAWGFYVINVDGTGRHQVLNVPICRQPSWSWSTNRLAFVCGELPAQAPVILSADMRNLLR